MVDHPRPISFPFLLYFLLSSSDVQIEFWLHYYFDVTSHTNVKLSVCRCRVQQNLCQLNYAMSKKQKQQTKVTYSRFGRRWTPWRHRLTCRCDPSFQFVVTYRRQNYNWKWNYGALQKKWTWKWEWCCFRVCTTTGSSKWNSKLEFFTLNPYLS